RVSSSCGVDTVRIVIDRRAAKRSPRRRKQCRQRRSAPASHVPGAGVPSTNARRAPSGENSRCRGLRAKGCICPPHRPDLRRSRQNMSLSSEEYRDHLQSTSLRAGFSFDDVVLPDERGVAVNGLRLRYLDWGTIGKRPILFLHGGALTAHTWDLCCLALRADYHCLALDQRGHGDSDWAPDADYSIASQRQDIRGFAAALGLDGFVLVGMSMGAINGLAYAIAYPETLSALVLIDAGPHLRRPGSRRIRDFVNGGAE